MAVGPEELSQARDAGTPARQLARLAAEVRTASTRRGDGMSALEKAVLAAVAGNPNTAPALLFELASGFPGEVVRNPAVFLLLLEDPALLEKIPDHALRAILAHPEAPVAWLGLAVERPEAWIRWLVAASPRTPPDVLARLAGNADATTRIAVAANPRTPVALLARFARTEDDAGPTLFALRRAVAGNPSAPLPTLEHLASDPTLLPFAAANPSLPEYLLEALSLHDDPLVRAALAKQPRLAPRLLRRLAADPVPEVRRSLARHATDPVDLHRLTAQDSTVLRALADNPSAPAPLLDRLRRAPLAKTRRAAERALAARAAATPKAP